jgi:toxin ParE1/3/4
VKLLRHRAAQTELRQAILWYERERGVGEDLAAEVRRAFTAIERAPERWPVWPRHARVRRYVLRRFPFSILYTVHDSVALVLAVAHDKRRPGYWLGRLSTKAKRKPRRR